MIDQLRQIAIFAKAVDHGSLRSAADALSISPSVVSHHIAQLEAHTGTALLYRSTRRISVTADGERLLAAAREMLAAAESGLEAIADRTDQPSGALRITAPAVLARSPLFDRIAAFAIAHPKVRLDLDLTDARREIIGDGIDVAIRMGWLRDSALKAKKLYEAERKLVASSTYYEARPTPASPKDLADWDWITFAPAPSNPEFRKAGRRMVRLKVASQIRVNDAHALHRLVAAGAGIAPLPDSLCSDDIARGALKEVLSDWSVPSLGVYAVWPPNAPKGGLTARFVGFLSAGRFTAAPTSDDADRTVHGDVTER